MAISLEQIRKELAEELDERERQAECKRNPYKNYLLFLAGLITFSLGVIAAVFTALPDESTPLQPPGFAVLGGVLTWISITALLASAMALVLQTMASVRRDTKSTAAVCHSVPTVICALPVITGLMAVAYCVRGGAAMLNGKTHLLGLTELWQLLVC